LFIGSIFEGESVVLLGGLAAHENYLLFPLVVLFAALGAIVGDWGFFFLGRYKGQSFFKRFPSLLKMSQKPRELIEKRPRFLSFAMRFMYGFRHIVPASLGASNIPTRQFLFWNGLGAVSWALLG
jgi:membrane protein DedA with SNARE-associated domain